MSTEIMYRPSHGSMYSSLSTIIIILHYMLSQKTLEVGKQLAWLYPEVKSKRLWSSEIKTKLSEWISQNVKLFL